eukprot:18588-Heterococcus_DN1.PRE.2
MLNAAGANDHLAAAKWLRQQGADWPPVLRHSGQEQRCHGLDSVAAHHLQSNTSRTICLYQQLSTVDCTDIDKP